MSPFAVLRIDGGIESREESLHIRESHQVCRLIKFALYGYVTVRISLFGHDINTHIMTFGIGPFIPEPDI